MIQCLVSYSDLWFLQLTYKRLIFKYMMLIPIMIESVGVLFTVTRCRFTVRQSAADGNGELNPDHDGGDELTALGSGATFRSDEPSD